MSAVDRLVRVKLEVTCRVRGPVDEQQLASYLAQLTTKHPFHLGGAIVFPTAACTPVRAPSKRRTRRERPPDHTPRTVGRGAPR